MADTDEKPQNFGACELIIVSPDRKGYHKLHYRELASVGTFVKYEVAEQSTQHWTQDLVLNDVGIRRWQKPKPPGFGISLCDTFFVNLSAHSAISTAPPPPGDDPAPLGDSSRIP